MRAPARAGPIDITIWGSMIAATLPQAQGRGRRGFDAPIVASAKKPRKFSRISSSRYRYRDRYRYRPVARSVADCLGRMFLLQEVASSLVPGRHG